MAATIRTLTREGRSYEPLETALRHELAPYFAPDNAALGDWLGRAQCGHAHPREYGC